MPLSSLLLLPHRSFSLSLSLALSLSLFIHPSLSLSLLLLSWIQCSDCRECRSRPVRGWDRQCSWHAHHDRSPWRRGWTAGIGLDNIHYCRALSYSILIYCTICCSFYFSLCSALKASKKGIMEAADMVVVNKADGEIKLFTVTVTSSSI